MKLLINIPAYNEDEVIAKTIRSLPSRVRGFSRVKVQIIDDGSIDKTRE
ncbi:glycosyltransferase, partial [Patescibacteria group bacterium]|nr:glycosyltransferase [Patescibacteria group bacterium]